MRFEIEFGHPDTGERQTIVVELAADEIEKARGVELYQHAFVLQRAYRMAAPNYIHIRGAIRPLAIH